MQRDIERFERETFDALIIGGGIHGAAIVRELTACGLRAALVDQADFCSGASANSLKVIHGGIRYLQHLNIKRMRESIHSRRRLLRELPHLVKSLPCLMPTRGHGIKGGEVMRVALLLNDLIGYDRNAGLAEDSRIPRGRLVSLAECRRLIPGVPEEGLTGAALWYDALAENTERVVLTFLHEAAEHGAVLANYLRAEKLETQAGAVTAVRCRDELSGNSVIIKAGLVINAAGAWVDEVLGDQAQNSPLAKGWAKALNIVVDKKMFNGFGVGLEGTGEFYDRDAMLQKGKRLFFFVPWRGKTMIGTHYEPYDGAPGDLRVTADDLRSFLDEVNLIYPAAGLVPADIVFYHAGLVPVMDAATENRGDVRLDKHSQLIDHGQTGGPANLISLKGVKYTTAVTMAERVRDMALKHFARHTTNKHVVARRTAPQSGPVTERANTIFAGIHEKYGDRASRVIQYIDDPRDPALVATDPCCTVAEVLYAVRHEMAVHLTDVLLRRSDIASAGRPEQAVMNKVGEIMAAELGWDEQRLEREIRLALVPYSGLPI